MKTDDLNNKLLYSYYTEHVKYEVSMLHGVANVILNKSTKQLIIRNALVESFAIHLRNLIIFLYPSTLRDTDVCAKNFFINEKTWEEIRPELSETLKKAKYRADKEVGHLTMSRQNSTPKSKEWDIRNLIVELIPIFKLFCDRADKVKLEPSI